MNNLCFHIAYNLCIGIGICKTVLHGFLYTWLPIQIQKCIDSKKVVILERLSTYTEHWFSINFPKVWKCNILNEWLSVWNGYILYILCSLIS